MNAVCFFRYLESSISFYQMLGRGTRIHEDTAKYKFWLYDYTGVTDLFGTDFITKDPTGRSKGKGTGGDDRDDGTDPTLVVEMPLGKKDAEWIPTMPRPPQKKTAPKSIASLGSLSAFVKGVCDVMRRSNCASALQYVPELTWILFLRILDAQESRDEAAALIQGRDFSPALRPPHRWQDWAAPYSEAPDHPRTTEGRPQVMSELAEGGRCGIVLDEGLVFRTNERAFVETKRRLLPARGTPAADSGLSWTLDIEARREQAREAMAPHLAEAERRRAQAIHWRAKAAALRWDKAPELELTAALAHLAAAEREAREAQTRADAIDAAVFDLKAVNPRARGGQDRRSPEAVLSAIAAHQRTIDTALARLGNLLADPDLAGVAEGAEPADQPITSEDR